MQAQDETRLFEANHRIIKQPSIGPGNAKMSSPGAASGADSVGTIGRGQTPRYRYTMHFAVDLFCPQGRLF